MIKSNKKIFAQASLIDPILNRAQENPLLISVTSTVKAELLEEEDESVGEFQVAEYIIFLLALDTYERYAEETSRVDNVEDALIKKGLRILRMADTQLDAYGDFIESHLEKPSQKAMLRRALNFKAFNPAGAARRALQFRTLLTRGGTSTVKGILENPKYVRQVKQSIAASMLDDSDKALDIFAAIPMLNIRMRDWIDAAAKQAGSGQFAPEPVDNASNEIQDSIALTTTSIKEVAAVGAQETQINQDSRSAMLATVQENATAAAKKSLEINQKPDEPMKQSEVVGIATAAAIAAISDPAILQNIPVPLQHLDDEQRAAALTGGRVRVAAGAGSGKCVRGDTLVRTARGLVPIQEFADGLGCDQSSALEETVLGVHGQELTSTILNNGKRPTIRLTTRLGYQLEGTLNHPILVLREGLVQWVPLVEVDWSDFICIDRRVGLFSEVPYRVIRTPFSKVTNSEPSQIPSELTSQVASLLGYIVSEGQVVYGQHSTVNLTTTDEDQLNLYKDSVEGIVSKWSSFYDESEGHWCLRFYRRSNLEALADFGLTYTLAYDKEIPDGILRSPKAVIVAFLRALFDGDGGFCNNTVYYDSSSEKLARGVHTLLLSFGIISRLKFRPNDKQGCWNIAITGDDARVFLQEIGFNLVRKQRAAEEALTELNSNPNLDVIPGLAWLFQSIMDSAKATQKISEHPKYHAFKCYRMGTRNPSVKMIREFLVAYPVDTEDFKKLQEFSVAPWFFDSVGEVLSSESKVYDFVVPGTHSFSAGGFVNHNSTTLVSRIEYLVKDGRVNPARIMACSFNKKAAVELEDKIKGKLSGVVGTTGVQVGTMHALFKNLIGTTGKPGFGTPEEKAMLTPPRLIAPPWGKQKTINPSSLSLTIRNMWMECGPDALVSRYGYPRKWVENPPQAKKAGLLLNAWRGNDVTLEQAKASVNSQAEAQAVIWYEMYLGLKGDIPGWLPPCNPSKPYESFMLKNRKGKERLGDMDDMFKILRDILRRDPKAKGTIQGMYDHILVDECIHETTEVTTDSGIKLVKGLAVGDKILSFENGSAVFKRVSGIRQSSKTNGVIVRTKSGRELAMTEEHRLYATEFEQSLVPNGQLALYLMYRSDKGFRIGVTGTPISRSRSEKADRLWVLEVGEPSEILYKEQAYSLEYRIPTYVFEAEVRGCDQERVDRIFSNFGSNGKGLLEYYGLSVDYPHWVSTSYSGSDRRRIVIHLMAHQKGGYNRVCTNGCYSKFCFSWTGAPDLVPESTPTYQVSGGRSMASFASPCYTKVREQAVYLANHLGATLWETLDFEGVTLPLTTAKALFIGMKLLVYKSGLKLDSNDLLRGSDIRKVAVDLGFEVPPRGSVSLSTYLQIREQQISLGVEPLPLPDSSLFELDEIVEITNGEGSYLDISIEGSSNFFANGILSHNCQDLNTVQHQIFEMMSEHISQDSKSKSIWMVGDVNQSIYGFRGAKPELFQNLEEGWVTRTIRTNYRCQPEIVEAANRLIERDSDGTVIASKSDPRKSPGQASIQVNVPDSNVEAAIDTIGRYRKDIDEGAATEDFAVLARTNAELNDFETACIINEIPYIRRGGRGFLEAPESKAVLGYIDLATGNDYEKMRDSLISILTKPDRGIRLSRSDLEKAVDEALDEVARKQRVDVRNVRPDILLDSHYVRVLADRLKMPYRAAIVDSMVRRGKSISTAEYAYGRIVDDLADALRGIAPGIRDLQDYIESNHTTEELLNYILDNTISTVKSWDSATRTESFATSTLREQISEDAAIYSDDEQDIEEEDDKETDVHKELGEEGLLKIKEKSNQGKGLGAVQFLFSLAQPNENDQKEATDPALAQGYIKKLARYSKLAATLRVDPVKWEKKQQELPPGLRKEKPPAITLSTVHCSPPDELILTTSGWVPIGDLDPSQHRLASYMKGCNQLLWGRSGKRGPRSKTTTHHEGYAFVKGSRPYSGNLIKVVTDRSTTRVTPNHRLLVRLSDSFMNKYVVYLMRRGDWWRVGHCVSATRPYKAGGVEDCLGTEEADAGWVLGVFPTKAEALKAECVIQGTYGIPGVTFEAYSDTKGNSRILSSKQLHAIHEGIRSHVAPRVLNLLRDYGLDIKYPLYVRGLGPEKKNNYGVAFLIRACNLLSGYMELPVPSPEFSTGVGTKKTWIKPCWSVLQVEAEPYHGEVFSLRVVPHEYYVSGGAIVHNSVKGAQWQNVAVVMPKGLFPMERTPKPDDPPPDPIQEEARMKAERNLAYVALTRAAVNLEITCPKGMSPFVFDAGLAPGENVSKPGVEPQEVTKESSTDLVDSIYAEGL